MKPISLLLALLCSSLVACAAPQSSNELLSKAKATALADGKAIFLHFGASWCGWCKRLDAFLEKPETKNVFDKYFVELKLVVMENDKNKALENPGAESVLKKLGGPAGLPYFAFLSSKGDLIINSKRPSGSGAEAENIGYPAQPAEVEWFLHMLKAAAPKISADELKTIQRALEIKKT